jgi:Tfp pilus assembly protein PilO
MKEMSGKFFANLHWVIVIYVLYAVWVKWDEHTVEMESVETELTSLTAEAASAQKSVSEIEDNKARINEFKVRVEEVAKNIEAVQKQLPAEINETQIVSYLNQEMGLLSIKDSKLVPGKEEPTTYYLSKDFVLTAKGTFLQFLIFFERIGNADRIYNVKGLKLKTSGDNQRGRFQILEAEGQIQAFRYNPEFKVDLGFEKAPGQPTAVQ